MPSSEPRFICAEIPNRFSAAAENNIQSPLRQKKTGIIKWLKICLGRKNGFTFVFFRKTLRPLPQLLRRLRLFVGSKLRL